MQDGVYDAFAAKLTAAVGGMKQGSGFEDGVSLGPLINERGVDKAEAHVADAVANGARVLTGGGRLAEKGANYFAPTVLADVTDRMLVFREETFGPV